MDEEDDQAEALNQQQDTALETANEAEEETIEDVKAMLAAAEAAKTKAEEIADNQRIRAEKAEKKAQVKPQVESKPAPKAGDMSQDDLYAVIKANVPQEDISDVKEYATLKGISVAEALKSNVVKTILADKAEQRNVAEATNTGTVRRGSATVSDQTLLEGVSKGQLPDDPASIAEARMRQRKGSK